MLTLFQTVCFPVYGIPKVRRGDHIILDRRALHYLNIIEKVNCAYCAYFTGIIAYGQEIAARTEQYWCPIKHARKVAQLHSRYIKFFEFGDAEGYRNDLEKVRRDFGICTGKGRMTRHRWNPAGPGTAGLTRLDTPR